MLHSKEKIITGSKIKTYLSPFFPGCGLAADNLGAQERIVGGREAGFGSFPWQVHAILRLLKAFSRLCSWAVSLRSADYSGAMTRSLVRIRSIACSLAATERDIMLCIWRRGPE